MTCTKLWHSHRKWDGWGLCSHQPRPAPCSHVLGAAEGGVIRWCGNTRRPRGDLLTDHYSKVLAALSPRQLLVNLHSKAGSGKAQAIISILIALERMAEEADVRQIANSSGRHYGRCGDLNQRLYIMFRIRRKCLDWLHQVWATTGSDSFANNHDFSSQIGFAIALTDINDNANIIH